MIRGRGFTRGGAFVDFILVLVLLMLGYAFMVRRNYMGTVDSVVGRQLNKVDKFAPREEVNNMDQKPKESMDEKDRNGAPGTHEELQHLVDVRVKKVADARPRDCKDAEYDVKDKVTVIIDFFDYQSYDLKTTLGSVYQNTPEELLHEVIVINDGSTLDYVIKDVEKFTSLYPRTKLVNNKIRMGQMKARDIALKHATTDIVAFVDTNVLCNQGWLEPLLALIKRERNVIAVPHYDQIKDPVSFEYHVTHHQLVSTFSWSMAVRMAESDEALPDVTAALNTNVMRGNAFVVHKDLLKLVAGFDTSFEEPGGEYLELSLRTWMCGGAIRVVPCSRVGVLNLHDPVKIGSHKNTRRIAELWLSDRKDLVYKYTGISSDMSEKETDLLGKRKTMLQALQCKNMKWYMENVARDIPTPSKDAVHYGMLRCKTGRCARVGSDKRIDLGTCSHQKYNVMRSDLLFEMDHDQRIKVNNLCLTVKESAYILAEQCNDGDTQQKWNYEGDHMLKNVWSGFCAMHVTDPDKKTTDGTRQIAMAQECKNGGDDFVTWEFGTP